MLPSGTPACFTENTTFWRSIGVKRASACAVAGVVMPSAVPMKMDPAMIIGTVPTLASSRPTALVLSVHWIVRAAPSRRISVPVMKVEHSAQP